MKTISVRVLAATIKTLREPVEVVTLDKASRQVVPLGVFIPRDSVGLYISDRPQKGQDK